ncbi:MAG: hypothetical protein KDA59_16475, partial [Planctomycetales bacterium]|nr:hypothetical protein [Planctomycetales bacterium]
MQGRSSWKKVANLDRGEIERSGIIAVAVHDTAIPDAAIAEVARANIERRWIAVLISRDEFNDRRG